MLTWFASNQIRNVACIGGNIVTASPISDLNPLLTACGAVLTLAKASTESDGVVRRQVAMKDFFLGYRKVNLAPTEVLEYVFIPFTSEFEFVAPFKQARRREDDISIVTCGLKFGLVPVEGSWKVESCILSYGGMAPTTISALSTADSLKDQLWSFPSLQRSFAVLRNELSLPEEVPGGQSEYRMSLAVSFLFKGYVTITNELAQYLSESSSGLPAAPLLAASELSAAENFLTADKPASQSQQHFTARISSDSNTAVGTSIPHTNAELQVSGETKYTGDMALPSNALHACLVTSTRLLSSRLSFLQLSFLISFIIEHMRGY